jgi:hypothetical protein
VPYITRLPEAGKLQFITDISVPELRLAVVKTARLKIFLSSKNVVESKTGGMLQLVTSIYIFSDGIFPIRESTYSSMLEVNFAY